MANAVTEEVTQSSNNSKLRPGSQQNNVSASEAAGRHEGAYITWDAFRDTLIQWVSDQGSDFVQTVADQEGFLSRQEVQCLYQLVLTFFV